jgi:hypothetical protein
MFQSFGLHHLNPLNVMATKKHLQCFLYLSQPSTDKSEIARFFIYF